MGFRELKLKNEYRTSIDSIPTDFYEPIMKSAITYDRAVGFFSSSSLAQIANGLIPFIKNNGYIRIIASPILDEEDIQAIKTGYSKRDDVIVKATLRQLLNESDTAQIDRLNLLANLIADGRLDIRIALMSTENRYGIYHEKMGVFKDESGDVIAFSGSMNETVTGMSINLEAIDVFCSWKNTDSLERTRMKENTFEAIWNGNEPGVMSMDISQIKEAILNKYLRKKLEYTTLDDNDFRECIATNSLCSDKKHLPKIPKGFQLHDYQLEAISNWKKEGFKGIFDMATGTGKTYTGLGAIVKLVEYTKGTLAVVIVCPYQHLVEQWVEDIELFNIKPIIGYSESSQKDWKRQLESAIRDYKLKVKGRNFFCFITTNATFSSDFVQNKISRIKGDVLLLVDEAHNFGSLSLSVLMTEIYNYRLALSATLERHGDEGGTQALLDYFGGKCIIYDLDKAIEERKLTPYKYYPIMVSLTEYERANYDDLSRQLIKCLIKGKNGKIKLSERGKKLALKRSRIVAGAINKVVELERCIDKYKEDSYILVYCGATKPLEIDKEVIEVDEEDMRQIDIVTSLLGNKLQMKVSQFTSKENVAERTILKQEFSEGENLQALIAIKCLDEGVNIPKIKTAFILASTTNPKEYIQRRGRVLRLAKGKELAEIYDFITLPRPLDEVFGLTEEQMKREMTLVRNEVSRAEEFARIAINRVSAIAEIEKIKDAYDMWDYLIDSKEEYLYDE